MQLLGVSAIPLDLGSFVPQGLPFSASPPKLDGETSIVPLILRISTVFVGVFAEIVRKFCVSVVI